MHYRLTLGVTLSNNTTLSCTLAVNLLGPLRV
jgi:hypothetical protein